MGRDLGERCNENRVDFNKGPATPVLLTAAQVSAVSSSGSISSSLSLWNSVTNDFPSLPSIIRFRANFNGVLEAAVTMFCDSIAVFLQPEPGIHFGMYRTASVSLKSVRKALSYS